MKWLAIMSYEECFVGGECYNFWENLILNDESKVFISEISIICDEGFQGFCALSTSIF